MIFVKNIATTGRVVAFKIAMAAITAVFSMNAYAAGPYQVVEATGGSGAYLQVPADIPHADCSVAADVRLNAWLKNDVPNGARVLFPKNGCYGYDRTITLTDRKF